MGNYLFTTDALVQEIVRDAGDPNSAHDFGKSIVAAMYERKRVYVYDFAKNVVPGQGEKERGYWRDVGSLDAYYQANMDLVDVDPIFSLYNDQWPIFTAQHNFPPAKFVFDERAGGPRRPRHRLAGLARAASSRAATSHHSHPVAQGAGQQLLARSRTRILFENVNIGRHCRIRRAIIDKHVEIPARHDHRLRPRGRTASASTSPRAGSW